MVKAGFCLNNGQDKIGRYVVYLCRSFDQRNVLLQTCFHVIGQEVDPYLLFQTFDTIRGDEGFQGVRAFGHLPGKFPPELRGKG